MKYYFHILAKCRLIQETLSKMHSYALSDRKWLMIIWQLWHLNIDSLPLKLLYVIT